MKRGSVERELNGSAAMLIQGLQGVIKETVEESIKPVIETMAAHGRVSGRED